MTCIRMGGAIICVGEKAIDLTPYGSRVWMELHRYLGPTFFRSPSCDNPINAGRKTRKAFKRWQTERPDEYEKYFGAVE